MHKRFQVMQTGQGEGICHEGDEKPRAAAGNSANWEAEMSEERKKEYEI
jgi:hypothetical protein